ncbi:MAG: hypothetical protein C5B51_26385 [Terriglobia bacterium]|nr:MAG: hypothetical protein C5B51_26385 [Terriglobia bacterium]
MANPEHLAILRQGMEVWNRWRETNRVVHPDLAAMPGEIIDFTGQNFSGFNFWNTYLNWADLSGATLSGTSFNAARLGGASFRNALMEGSSLIYADLIAVDFTEANLVGADLTRANCNGADFARADFTDVIFSETILTNVNFAGSVGLATCQHAAPSAIDFRTIVKSGSLPEAFLRGCGLPDVLIDYFPSLIGMPVQFYSCFISYSTSDSEFAERLYADFQSRGVRCWFAPHDIQGGKKIHEQIDEAIRVYDRLLLILSDASMNSEWVKTEIANARQREIREKGRMLFPISLVPYKRIKEWKAFDGDTGKDSAREIREYFIPDFSNWKDHDSYQQAFQRLLRDLKAVHGAK